MARLPISLSRLGNARDLGLAAFAAASIAFAALAMPDWRLTQLVETSGLAAIFPPAQPPLGNTARLGLALVAGFVSFAFFAWLLRFVSRAPAGSSTIDANRPPEPIRLRRADAHPDAPARRPLVAGRDLGEPLEELVLEVPQPEPEPEPEPIAELVPEPAVEIVVEEPEPAPDVLTAEPITPAPEPEPQREESISALMKRLESGITRKERAIPPPDAAPPSPADDAVGHRLRSAISDLQKLAARASH